MLVPKYLVAHANCRPVVVRESSFDWFGLLSMRDGRYERGRRLQLAPRRPGSSLTLTRSSSMADGATPSES